RAAEEREDRDVRRCAWAILTDPTRRAGADGGWRCRDRPGIRRDRLLGGRFGDPTAAAEEPRAENDTADDGAPCSRSPPHATELSPPPVDCTSPTPFADVEPFSRTAPTLQHTLATPRQTEAAPRSYFESFTSSDLDADSVTSIS